MHDRVETQEVARLDGTDVFSHPRDVGHGAARGECAVLVEIAVEPVNLVARLKKHGGQDGSDIALVPRDQYLHAGRSHTAQGRLPLSQRFCSTRLSRNVSIADQNPSWK
jgi:hypothetical protein